jgi:hypothetical protein
MAVVAVGWLSSVLGDTSRPELEVRIGRINLILKAGESSLEDSLKINL